MLQIVFLSQDRFSGNHWVNDVVVKPAECIRTGMEYDVEISLYDTENLLRGLTVLTTTVDVSDDVPVTTTKFRISTRRS